MSIKSLLYASLKRPIHATLSIKFLHRPHADCCPNSFIVSIFQSYFCMSINFPTKLLLLLLFFVLLEYNHMKFFCLWTFIPLRTHSHKLVFYHSVIIFCCPFVCLSRQLLPRISIFNNID